MQLAAFVVIFSLSITKICSAGLKVDSSKGDRSLVAASIDILESCYKDRTSTVGLAGTSIDSIIKAISSRDIVIPITLIGDTSRLVSHGAIDRASRHKLHVFVVTATNPGNLVKTLTHVKNTKWWNHMASFLLIDFADVEKNECSNAHQMLWEAWKMNLINSKFMCLNRTRGRVIYTFNPFTSKAPVPWQKENIYKGINDHIWTLFVREYRQDVSRCDELDFDKTLDLGGYVIHASVRGMENWWFPDISMKPTLINQVQNITAQTLISFLNAKWKFLLHPKDEIGRDKNGNPAGLAAEVINGTSDICLNTWPQLDWTEYQFTRTLFQGRLGVMTQYPGHKSQLDKIVSVLDISSRFGVLVVFMTTLLIFILWLRKPLILAILDLVLIICNAALRKIPNNSAPRLFLTGLFIFVVTIQGIYQSQFASLLTKEQRLPVVNTIEDLARSYHAIYGFTNFRSFFNQTAFKGRFVGLPKLSCTENVLQDPKAACVHEKFSLIDDALKFNLHLSEESMGTLDMIYLMRPDWPLEDRVNEIYDRIFASDILRPQYSVEFNNRMRILKRYENENQDQAAKVLTLKELGFAFAILAIGLGCATITFIIEVATFNTAVAKFPSRIRRRIRFIK